MKETRLQEDAYIYHKRQQRNEKQKWKELKKGQRWQYFKDYYLLKTVAGLAAAGFSAWLLLTMLSPKPETALYIALVNSGSAQEKEAQLEEQLKELLGGEEEETVILDSTYFLQLESMDQGSLAAVQKLSAQIYSNMLDIIIADEKEFHYFARQGYFMDLAEALPTNVYSRLSDQIYMDRTEEESEEGTVYGEDTAYGVYLQGFSCFEALQSGLENPVIGIVVNTKQSKNGAKALEYLCK